MPPVLVRLLIVFVEEPAESVVSADVQTRRWFGDRFRQGP